MSFTLATQKVIHCKFCNRILKDEERYAEHISKSHREMMIPGMEPRQFVYYLRTGKTHGNCIQCHGETSWNETNGKYNRFCNTYFFILDCLAQKEAKVPLS